MAFVPGDRVGPYEIVDRHGKGGMATVYRAHHAALDRFVALKFLNPAYSDDSNFLARFQREGRVVARLEHPNIVPIYDYAEYEGTPYLAMKFIEGETLKDRLIRGPLKLEEGRRIVEDVGQALIFAHKQGVLHRDIKPSNILITEDGKNYLADFGLARISQMGSSTLSSEMLLGTPHYISPEQAQGNNDLDERTDVYSFGALLYEIVVGQVPFDGDTPYSIIHDHIYEPLPLPRSINPDVPEPVERVLVKALAKIKAERYESVEKLLSAFLATTAGDRIGVLRSPSSLLAKRDDVADVDEVPAAWADAPIVEPAANAEIILNGDESGADAEQKKQRNWGWIIAGVILACGCLAVVFNARGLLQRDWGQTPTVQQSTPAHRTVIPRGTLTATVGSAEHLRTAVALATAGLHRDAVQEYLAAGDQFLAQKAYLQAAKIFKWLIDEIGGPSEVGFSIRDSLTEAIFMGVTLSGMDVVIAEIKADYPEWAVVPIVEARAMLFDGDIEGSAQLIDNALLSDPDNALLSDPDDALAMALQAEWLIDTGKLSEAERIVRLLSRRQLPPWLSERVAELSVALGGTP